MVIEAKSVSIELAQDRVTERILCTVIREASKLLNDLLLKQNIISMCMMRQDSMLRTNFNPVAHPVTFSTPVLSMGLFIFDFNTDELLQWIDDWGNRMMRQQKEDTRLRFDSEQMEESNVISAR